MTVEVDMLCSKCKEWKPIDVVEIVGYDLICSKCLAGENTNAKNL